MKIFDPKEAREPFSKETDANFWLHSSHKREQNTIQKADESLRSLVGLDPEDQLLLYYHKTQAAKALFQAVLEEKIQESGKIQIIVHKDLDPAIHEMMDSLSNKGCMKIILATKASGQIDLEELKKQITFKTALISCSYTNPKTGLIEPVLELSELCKEKNILLHLDLDEAIGPHFLDFSSLSCDFATLNCNTFFAPTGSSLLAIKKNVLKRIAFCPMEANLLLNTARAAEQYGSSSKELLMEIARQRRIFESRMIEDLDAKILFQGQKRSYNMSLVQIPNCNHESLSFFLASKQILTGFDRDLNCLILYFSIHTNYEEFQELTEKIILMGQKIIKIGTTETNAI